MLKIVNLLCCFSACAGLFAGITCLPLGARLMSKWLENFAYHIDLNGWILLAEIAIIASVVLLTVGYKAFTSAVMDPVKALRTE